MKKGLQVLLHILGFPAMLAVIAIVSVPIIADGMSYGIMVFVGLIVAVLMTVIYYVCFAIITKSKKKSKTKQTISLVLTVFFILCFFWIVVDIALPNFFADATSDTIYYEDIIDDYAARAAVNKALMDEYVRRNYMNGNLGGKVHSLEDEEEIEELEKYQKEGIKNDEVKKLLTIHFASIDGNGYATFTQPWISLATSDRLTIPTLIHLLLDERKFEELSDELYADAVEGLSRDPLKWKWNVLDMMGEDMALPMETSFNGPIKIIGGVVAPLTEAIVGSPLIISANDESIILIPSNEARGVLDYQSMAWLNANGLIYAIVTLMVTRKFFFIFGAFMIFSNFAIGMLRGMGDEDGLVNHGEKPRKGGRKHNSDGAYTLQNLYGNPYGNSYGGVNYPPYPQQHPAHPQYPRNPYNTPNGR